MSSHIINYFVVHIIQVFFPLLFRNQIGKYTSFWTITGGVISRQWVSSANHALAALLLAPETVEAWKFARQQQQGILPSQRSQLACDCLVWGIRPVCGLATVWQITKIKGFTGCGPVHCVYFCVFNFSMICKCLSNMQIDKGYEERSQCDVQVLTSRLKSLASKSQQQEN